MIANRKLSLLIATGCYALFFLWLYFFLFIDSRHTSIDKINGKSHEVVRYDYKPSIPLIVLGVYGGIVGGLGSIIMRRKPYDQRLLSALAIAPGFTVLSTMILCEVWIIISPIIFHSPYRILPALVSMILYFPGVAIFGGIPTVLSGYATSCLFSGGQASPIIPCSPPPPQK